MAWQNSLAWVFAQDPRWGVAFAGAVAALYALRRGARFWRDRDDLWYVVFWMTVLPPLGAILLARSHHGAGRARVAYWIGAAVGSAAYAVPFFFAVHPVAFAAVTVLGGGALTLAFGLLSAPREAPREHVRDKLHQFGFARYHHAVASDGSVAIAFDPDGSLLVAAVGASFARRVALERIRSVDVFAGERLVNPGDAVAPGPLELRVVTDDLVDHVICVPFGAQGRVRRAAWAAQCKEAFAWRDLLRRGRARAGGAKNPAYLRELYRSGVLDESEYRTLLGRTGSL